MRNILRQAMQNPEELVVEFDYRDSEGICTTRVVSPIRFLSADRFLALCLCREEPRQFYLDRCSNVRRKQATDYVMPVPMA